MTSRQRRALAAVVAAIPVGGLSCGMTPSWSVNLTAGLVKGLVAGGVVFAGLTVAYRVLRSRA